MNYPRPLLLASLLSLSACEPPGPGASSMDMRTAATPPASPVLDPSCDAMASELANCSDIIDGAQYKPCTVSMDNVAKCTDICAVHGQCSVPGGAANPKTSVYLGDYAISSTFQIIPEQWPGHATLSSDTANTALVSGVSLTEEKRRLYSIPATLIEKDNHFLLVGAVRHEEPGCARANLEVFALSGTASGTAKQIGCLPIEVQHNYLPIQWCGQEARARSKQKLVQFTTTWKRLIDDGDRCAPQP